MELEEEEKVEEREEMVAEREEMEEEIEKKEEHKKIFLHRVLRNQKFVSYYCALWLLFCVVIRYIGMQACLNRTAPWDETISVNPDEDLYVHCPGDQLCCSGLRKDYEESFWAYVYYPTLMGWLITMIISLSLIVRFYIM
jgi:hypothetical protein